MESVKGIAVAGDWLDAVELQRLFDVLLDDGGQAMVSGGAVRNALMGVDIADVDLATTLLPTEVVRRLESAGYKAVPTGIDHGTVTAVIDGEPYEVTTLREDIETDGRHAVVRFGTGWEQDAARRDLTMNGLYCDRDGRVYDFVGGVMDIENKTVRFIGDANDRVNEDALRILRFFRFFAWYGSGRPDAAGLKACNANRSLLSGLSSERVWAELKKLLAAEDPARALLWMRTANVLAEILPESAKWGIDAVPVLIEQERQNGWESDPMVRLAAMVRPNDDTVNSLADRLTLSNADRQRLLEWAIADISDADAKWEHFEKQLYRGTKVAMLDKLKLECCARIMRGDEDGAAHVAQLVDRTAKWVRPDFPVSGSDLLSLGQEAGPQMGVLLKKLENDWIESGFSLSKEKLLAMR